MKNSFDEAIQFAKDYIDSEENECCRMIDEYDYEFQKEEKEDVQFGKKCSDCIIFFGILVLIKADFTLK